jgi:Protein kinase domain
MNAFPEPLATPALSAAEVKRWFELETPVDIIDAQLMRAVQSTTFPDIDVVCEVLAVVDQFHRRGVLDKSQYKRLKGRVERFAVAGAAQLARPQPSPPPLQRRAAPPASSEPAPAATATVLPFTPALRSGTVLRDRYVIMELLGEGGMSSVYRACDRKREGLTGHDGNIAIKVLRPALAGRPEAIKSLRLEYERAQRLSHQSIINVFDIDTDGDTHFMTMELLRGELLSDIIRRLHPGSLQRDQALEILRKLGVAVAFAHEQDVVHADLKPGNVMITQDGELRLFDFGAAWLAQREPWIYEAMQRSLQGATPTYASPERLTGGAPTIRDDIFSFSCLAYELLSGAHPFDRRPANVARDSDTQPARIPGLAQRQWRALKRGLAWQRQDRYGDMRELLRDLDPRPQRRSRHLNLVQLHAAIAPRHSRVAGLAMLLTGSLAFAAAHLIRAETPLGLIPAAVQPWVGGILRWLAQILPGVR